MKKFLLDGTDWTLTYVKNSVYASAGEIKNPTELSTRSYPTVPAAVPGNLEIDLMNAGVIEDPFYDKNHGLRDCEYLHAFYSKAFEYSGTPENPILVFEGLDTVADIYLNGILIAKTENMLISHEIDVTGAIQIGKNELTVHIRPAVIEARNYPMTLNENALPYNIESLHIRKAPHMYGWDIAPRIVSAGIWRSVYLKERKSDRIDEFYIYTSSCDQNKARLYFFFNTVISQDECLPYTVKITGKCGKSVFECTKKLLHTSGHDSIAFTNPKLWWPRFNGEQNLYDITVTLEKDGKILDTYKTRIGIRTVALDRTSTTDSNGSGEFCFKVNGKKIFCMGTNWVPVDVLHSRDEERMPRALEMLYDTNCNVVRLWGGNIYESDTFYDFCDEKGILIWQDFIMGCAVYPQDEEFQKKLYAEAVSVIKRLRHHSALVLWAGDNEVDFVYLGWGAQMRRDPNQNLLTRKVLPEAVRLHDYTRPYLPSSPYVDADAFKTRKPISEDHLWGPRDYFKGKYYGNSVCHFASETGYHGCPSPNSIAKFIPSENLWTSENSVDFSGIDNESWLYHAASPDTEKHSEYLYRIRLMANQVTTLFGSSVPNTLDGFARASQISQAEAKKYFIERFRLSKWRRTGIIWWNLLDGWPQFSDAVVDYYFSKKLAYHFIKRSQNPVCLMFDEPKDGAISLYAVNEFDTDKNITYTVTDLTADKMVASGKVTAVSESSVKIDSVAIDENEKHFYLIKWELDGQEYSNHYVTNIIDLDYSEYLKNLQKCGYYEFDF